jgi:cytochrome c oxidase cbb3-type subunit 3
MLGDKSAVEKGGTLYAERCAACHGDQGQGLIGPNLTDNYWLHGGKPEQIMKVIQKGVLDKGMPPWEDSMSEEEVMQAVAFIASIHGTNPGGAKEPQGEPYAP